MDFQELDAPIYIAEPSSHASEMAVKKPKMYR